jgi:uncharacterized protein
MEPQQPLPPNIPNSPPPPLATTTNWRLYLELLSFTAFVFPLGQIFGPLILWLIKKDTVPAVDIEGKRVINFNISWALWGLASCGIGFLAWIVIAIIATIKAANNEPYRHPWTIAFLK